MFPHVGLYLPESLFPKEPPPPSNHPKGERLERKSVNRRFWERRALESPIRTFTPSSTIQDALAVSSSLSTLSKFVDFVTSLKEVSTENTVFVNLIKRVRQDEAEALQMHSNHAANEYYESWPDRKSWVDAILLDVRRSLDEIGAYIESGRMTAEGGGAVGLKHRFEWVINHQQKLLTRQNSLVACHQSLMAAIQMLQMVEMSSAYGTQCQPLEVPTKPWLLNEKREILRSPHSRQKLRLGQRNGSVPSITMSSEYEAQSEVSSVNETPAELPGSTPEDLPRSDNSDLYESPPKPSTPLLQINSPSLPSLYSKTFQHVNAPLQRPRSSSDHITFTVAGWKSADVSTHQRSFGMSENATSIPKPRRSMDQVTQRNYHNWDVPTFQLREPVIQPSLVKQSQAPSKQVEQLSIVTEQQQRLSTVRPHVGTNSEEDSTDSSRTQFTKTRASKTPVLAMRYRPKAVHVRKPLTKHRSLPSELPFLPHHPSLTSELSHWVLPGVKDGTPESPQQFTELNTSSASQTASPIVPDTPASCPDTFQSVVSVASRISGDTETHPPQDTTDFEVPVGEEIARYKNPQPSPTLVSLGKTSVCITNTKAVTSIPRGDSPTIGVMEFKSHSTPMEGISESPTSSLKATNVGTRPCSPQITQIDSPSTQVSIKTSIRNSRLSQQSATSPSTTISSQDPTSPMGILKPVDSGFAEVGNQIQGPEIIGPQNMTSAIFTSEPMSTSAGSTSLSLNTSTNRVSPSNTPMSPIISLEPVDPGSTEPGVKPLTSQAKRRRAHARRMQAAYGLE